MVLTMVKTWYTCGLLHDPFPTTGKFQTNITMKTNFFNAGGVRLNDLNIKHVEIMGQTMYSIDLKHDII